MSSASAAHAHLLDRSVPRCSYPPTSACIPVLLRCLYPPTSACIPASLTLDRGTLASFSSAAFLYLEQLAQGGGDGHGAVVWGCGSLDASQRDLTAQGLQRASQGGIEVGMCMCSEFRGTARYDSWIMYACISTIRCVYCACVTRVDEGSCARGRACTSDPASCPGPAWYSNELGRYKNSHQEEKVGFLQ
jgi:hypothetical protein